MACRLSTGKSGRLRECVSSDIIVVANDSIFIKLTKQNTHLNIAKHNNSKSHKCMYKLISRSALIRKQVSYKKLMANSEYENVAECVKAVVNISIANFMKNL